MGEGANAFRFTSCRQPSLKPETGHWPWPAWALHGLGGWLCPQQASWPCGGVGRAPSRPQSLQHVGLLLIQSKEMPGASHLLGSKNRAKVRSSPRAGGLHLVLRVLVPAGKPQGIPLYAPAGPGGSLSLGASVVSLYHMHTESLAGPGTGIRAVLPRLFGERCDVM